MNSSNAVQQLADGKISVDKAHLDIRRALVRRTNRVGGKLLAIKAMTLQITEMDLAELDNAALILNLSEAIGMMAEDARAELGQLVSEHE
ncbi:hypothetical protein [Shewanella sp. S23-S33]|uniref:hypothetical protein n=1 Tax=Shewanella TaxID=22 RepID=UPI00372D3802